MSLQVGSIKIQRDIGNLHQNRIEILVVKSSKIFTSRSGAK